MRPIGEFIDEGLTACLGMEGLRLVKFVWRIVRHAGEDGSTFDYCSDEGRRGLVSLVGEASRTEQVLSKLPESQKAAIESTD